LKTAPLPGSTAYHSPRPFAGWVPSDRFLSFGDLTTISVEYLYPQFPPGYPATKRFLLEWAAVMLNQLLDLPDDWDGDGAAPVDVTAARSAMDFLESIADLDTLRPEILPVPSGGVQLEWLVGGVGLEVEVTPSGQVYAIGIDRHGKVELEGDAPDRGGASLQSDVREYLRSISLPLREER
jgi:hypothetical protein